MTQRPTDTGKELDPNDLKVGTDYYVHQFGSYVRFEVESIEKDYDYAYVHGRIPSRNEPRTYLVPRRTPSEIRFFEIDPDPVRRAVLQVAQTHTPSMTASPGLGPWNTIRGYVGDGIPYPKPPSTPELGGGYRATARDKKYLARLRAGKSIGFTMRASLKAKGLLPRANGSKRVSQKYRAQKRNVTRRRT